MHGTLSDNDRQFLSGVLRLDGARIESICDEFDVTPTAVRQRLARLQSLGMIDRETVSAGRGRPHHEYRVTTKGQQSLGGDYAALAQTLWREVSRLDDDELRGRLVGSLRDSLVERYRPQSSAASVADRFEQLGRALEEQGFAVAVDERQENGELLPVLREYACPYHELAADDPSICELEQSVFEEVLGVPVVLTQCCRDGHSCCEFEPLAGSV